MTADLMKKSKLAVAVVLSFGLGMARVLPVHAVAIAKPTTPGQSHTQPLDSYQFKLDDLALPAATKTQVRVAQTAFEPLNQSAETATPKASGATRGAAAKGQGTLFSEGFFSLVFFATVLYIIYNLIASNKSVADVNQSNPTTESSSSETAAIAALETTEPLTPGETAPDKPAAVPTPALLPGLLGLSLKLFRQKKAESRAAAL
jgi:hypothetical protein